MSNLELIDIVKSYGAKTVLHGINLKVEPGEFIVFVGPSGCGKSTLLQLIAGLDETSAGRIEIGGRDVTGLEPVERGISMVFQSYALYPHLSVYENIAFPLRLQKKSKAEVDEAVQNAARILDLTQRLDYKPSELSGGQRQRVAIGRAIVRNPNLFLFDEPLSNLDAALRGQMRVEISELHKNLKTTMIYVTHDQVEAMTMADRIVVLRDGRIEQFGTPMELYNDPQTKFVAGFIGQPNMNFIPGKISKTGAKITVESDNGFEFLMPKPETATSKGQDVQIGIRPEFLEFANENDGMEVNIRLVERLGSLTLIHGDLKDHTRIIASFDGMLDLPSEEKIWLKFDPDRAFLFGSDDARIS